MDKTGRYAGLVPNFRPREVPKPVEGSKSALIDGLACGWSKDLPNETGYWWWWNQDGLPIPVNIDWSPTDGGRYFATQGQHGWNRYQWVEDMGGYWMRLSEPEPPAS